MHGLPPAFYHTTRVCAYSRVFPIKQAWRYSGSWLAASCSGANAPSGRPWLRKPTTASTRPPRSMSDRACLAVYPQQLTPFPSACVPFMCCRCAVISCVGHMLLSRAGCARMETFFSRSCANYIVAMCFWCYAVSVCVVCVHAVRVVSPLASVPLSWRAYMHSAGRHRVICKCEFTAEGWVTSPNPLQQVYMYLHK